MTAVVAVVLTPATAASAQVLAVGVQPRFGVIGPELRALVGVADRCRRPVPFWYAGEPVYQNVVRRTLMSNRQYLGAGPGSVLSSCLL
ncbi:hypothetical protein OG842_01365 [Streptomyces sp. NBC_00376]|uniref:hypothetical protein n=1 Tax=unclassified Streptomyces TaxID=2593676 RepID=UPI00225AF85B|nr:hypothetical protein [Streptomyces sp. NBC_00378]